MKGAAAIFLLQILQTVHTSCCEKGSGSSPREPSYCTGEWEEGSESSRQTPQEQVGNPEVQTIFFTHLSSAQTDVCNLGGVKERNYKGSHEPSEYSHQLSLPLAQLGLHQIRLQLPLELDPAMTPSHSTHPFVTDRGLMTL